MRKYLRALARLAPGPLAAVALLIVERLIAVYDWAEGIARVVHDRWDPIGVASTALRKALGGLVEEIYRTLRWLADTRIGQLVRSAVDTLRRWVTSLVNDARGLARSLVDNLRRWVTDRVRDALGLIDAVRRWAAGLLATMRDAVRRLLERVFGVLATPGRLAAWAIGAIWAAWWRYAWDHRDKLIDALWRALVPTLGRAAREIERQLGRLI